MLIRLITNTFNYRICLLQEGKKKKTMHEYIYRRGEAPNLNHGTASRLRIPWTGSLHGYAVFTEPQTLTLQPWGWQQGLRKDRAPPTTTVEYIYMAMHTSETMNDHRANRVIWNVEMLRSVGESRILHAISGRVLLTCNLTIYSNNFPGSYKVTKIFWSMWYRLVVYIPCGLLLSDWIKKSVYNDDYIVKTRIGESLDRSMTVSRF